MDRDKIFLNHILESINLIIEYTIDVNEQAFFEKTEVQDKVFRRLEIIGEAIKNISNELKSKYVNVPWKQAAGLRDILIHSYFAAVESHLFEA